MDVELWTTNVGSHLWNMARPDSDHDYFTAYLASTRELLAGTADMSSKCAKEDPDIDRALHEAGTVVSFLLKGNVNFIWGIYSPIVIKDDFGVLKSLRKAAPLPRANVYHSIRGLAKHNYAHYVTAKNEHDVTPEKLQKKLNTIARSIKLGIHLLEEKELEFKAVKNTGEADIPRLIEELEKAYAATSLPETFTVQEEARLRDWLVGIRSTLGGRV
jgi:predicted nucleotidyltransferase